MSDPVILLDAAGRRRSPATMPGYLAGHAPRNKGMEYPPDPPQPEEIVLVMPQAGHDRHGLRIRALIAVLWRAGLRISEALALNETDLDPARGSVLVRHGKGNKRRQAGMDQFAFALDRRVAGPPGAAPPWTVVLRHRRRDRRATTDRDGRSRRDARVGCRRRG
jgi:integrase